MNGLYGIWCKLCELFSVIGKLCGKVDDVVMNHELLCDKIDQIVGDPNAECPDCAEPEAGGLIAQEQVRTQEVVAVTAKIQASALALKTQFTRTVKEAAAQKAE